jgi:hypothetical protein
MLPDGLELGAAEVAEAGKHPVVLYFGNMFKAQLSVGPFPAPTDYREHVVGVPYTVYKAGRGGCGGYRGPFFYMPQLYLDSLVFTLGGLIVWGFNKARANFKQESRISEETTHHSYAVSSRRWGDKLVDVTWHAESEAERVECNKAFEIQRRIMSQPVISRQPLAIGPFFSCSDYDKTWSTADVKPIRTRTSIRSLYVPGLSPGDYEGQALGEKNPLGSFELRTHWSLTFPYGCGCARQVR